MNMIATLNSISCLVLLVYLIAAALASTRVVHRAAVCFMAWAVVLQFIDPIVDWVPEVAWPSALFNASLVVCITVYRNKLWRLVQSEFDPKNAPRTRASDRLIRRPK